MSLKSKLKIESMGILATVIFYITVGVICFAALPLTNFPPHIGIIGILSLITAYDLFRKRVRAIWFVTILFFVASVYSAYTLYRAFGTSLLLDISSIAYLLLTWIFTVYMIANRKKLEH